MEQALTDLLKQGPTVAVLIIVLYKLFGLYTSQQDQYREIIDELKEVVKENTAAINNFQFCENFLPRPSGHDRPIPKDRIHIQDT